LGKGGEGEKKKYVLWERIKAFPEEEGQKKFPPDEGTGQGSFRIKNTVKERWLQKLWET